MNGKLLFNEVRVSFLQHEKNSVDRDVDNSTTVWMYLMPLNFTIKNGRDVKPYMHNLWQFFKEKNLNNLL